MILGQPEGFAREVHTQLFFEHFALIVLRSTTGTADSMPCEWCGIGYLRGVLWRRVMRACAARVAAAPQTGSARGSPVVVAQAIPTVARFIASSRRTRSQSIAVARRGILRAQRKALPAASDVTTCAG